MVTAELVENKTETPKKFKYKLNYGSWAETQGYDDVYSETVEEIEMDGKVQRKVTRKVVDVRPRKPRVYRSRDLSGKKLHPEDTDIIETDLELDRIFPSLPSSGYPMPKFQRIDGRATGQHEIDDAAREAYKRGLEEGRKLATAGHDGAPIEENDIDDATVNGSINLKATYEAMEESALRQHAENEEIDLTGCNTKNQMIKRIMRHV